MGGGHWRELAIRFGISDNSLALIDAIEIAHHRIANAFYSVGGGGERINPASLAMWLVNRSNIVGSQQAYNELCALEADSKCFSYCVTLLNGVDINGAVSFDNGLVLSGYNSLPDNLKSIIDKRLINVDKDFQYVHAFVYQEQKIDLFSDERKSYSDRLGEFYECEDDIVRLLSLLFSTSSPQFYRRWVVLDESVPMSGYIDTGYSHSLVDKQPHYPLTFDVKDALALTNLYTSYKKMPERMKRLVKISLWRRSQAINSWSLVDAAIDIGIALESVLTDENASNQLALQIRILGSKLAYKEFSERSKAFSVLKTVYELRSHAVHNGTLNDTYKVKGVGRLAPRAVLDLGLEILTRCLIEIINRSGIDADAIERLYLE